MDINRLFPPNIAGTIPSFYTTNTGTSLEVPFSMNVTVSNAAVKGMRLRLKTTSTDIIIANVFSQKYGDDSVNRSVIYELNDDIVAKLVVGNFYKVQLAYVDQSDNDGYYSTVAIVKYTERPTLSIAGLNMQSVTTIASNKVIGTYSNGDDTEKVYQYRFVLKNTDNKILQDSGWLIHNVQTDSALDTSQDEFIISYNLTEGNIYRLQYSIITNNGLRIGTVNYEIVQNAVSSTILNVYLSTEVDQDNARVILSVHPDEKYLELNEIEEYPLMGSFVICRKQDGNADALWETLAEVSLNILISKNNPYQFIDYAVEAGAKYLYSFQKFNSKNIFSKRITTKVPTVVTFEDAFLYDGQRQLRIRFNPNVSSFKSVVAETKKTTLGRQYPFILRNGILNYKEFPISGLISYWMDNDELFLSAEEIDNTWFDTSREAEVWGWREKKGTFNLTDENFSYERRFKMKVLEWLNNGGIKLFKSPQEGSFIVRLTNVSLSPNAQTSRMLHSFSCTASEISEFNIAALSNYALTSQQEETVHIDITKVINLREIGEMLGSSQALSNYDLTDGVGCRKVEFVWNIDQANQEGKAETYGMTFSWGEYNFAITRSGTYSLELENYSTSPLLYINPPNNLSHIRGYLILTLEAVETDSLETVQSVLTQTLYGFGLYGMEEKMEEVKWKVLVEAESEDEEDIIEERSGTFSRNLFEHWNDEKSDVPAITYFEYKLVPVVECGLDSLAYVWNTTLKNATIPAQMIYGDQIYLRKNNGTYWRYKPDNAHFVIDPLTNNYPSATDAWFEQVNNYGTKILFGNVEVDITELLHGEEAAMTNFFRGTPRDLDGDMVLRIQPGVQVYAYCSGSTKTYTVEEYEPVKYFSDKEKAEYEAYCMTLFNFAVVASQEYEVSMPPIETLQSLFLFIFDNRQFIEISAAQAQDYYNGEYTIYAPAFDPTIGSVAIYTKQDIQDRYEAWKAARKELMASLELNLD